MSIVVQTALFELESLLAEDNIAVEVEQPLPQVWCNETRASQVISNLVRNAIKHGCDPLSGRICISSPSTAARPLPPGFAWLKIHDNGRGIPAASREEIFLPGRRLKTAHPDGSGMGLAIVKKIIERAGGSIFVDPTCASGTAFVFSLPLPRAT
jgi:signal transduction histidine kinase